MFHGNHILDEAVEFLKSTGVYPTAQLMQLNKNVFTGQFICSVILTHIDLDYQLRSSVQLNHDLVHPKTFEILFDIIAQLTTILKESSNAVLIYMLTVCLRLFTTHLKYLSAMESESLSRFISNQWRDKKKPFTIL